MSQARIRAAFESRLAEWAKLKALPVIWQNAKTAIPQGSHLRAFLLPAQTLGLDVAGNHRGWRGLFQVSIFSKPGIGSQWAESLAGELDELFPHGSAIDYHGLPVRIIAPVTIRAAVQETDWYSVPVDVRYAADIAL